LFKDEAKTQKTDELYITTAPGAKKEMEVQLRRASGGTTFVSYNYKLKVVE